MKSHLDDRQQRLLTAILEQLKRSDYIPLNQSGYFFPEHSNNERSLDIEWTLDGMDILMRECQGAMVLAFALWKVSDSSGEPLGFSSTENNHLEGALALSQGLPLLIIAEETARPRGIASLWGGRFILRVPKDVDIDWLDTDSFQRPFNDWQKAIDSRRHVFLGYCSMASSVANLVITFLEDQGIRVLDWQRDFTAGGTVLEQIEEAARRCTGGIFLFTNDDTLKKGSQIHAAPRDNVIFETGYFVQAKGKKRVLIIREGNTKLPADVGGDIYLPLQDRSDISSIKPSLMKFIQERIL